MSSTVQMNTRINKSIKSAGDSVLRRYGYTPSSAVNALWVYLSEHNALPGFMPEKRSPHAKDAQIEEIKASQGMALRMGSALAGIAQLSPEVAELSPRELKELGWEERGAFHA